MFRATSLILLLSCLTSGLSFGKGHDFSVLFHVLEHHIEFNQHSHHDHLESKHDHEESDIQNVKIESQESQSAPEGKPASQHTHNLQNSVDQQILTNSSPVKNNGPILLKVRFNFQSSLYPTNLTGRLFRPPRFL